MDMGAMAVRMHRAQMERAVREAGLVLTPQQVGELAEAERACLTRARRVSFGATAAPTLIRAIAGSPCLTGVDALEQLMDLVEAFYDLREDFPAQTTDLEIIEALREGFDGEAQGDAALAASLAREALTARERQAGYEITDDHGRVYRLDPVEWRDDTEAPGWDGERWEADYE